MNICKADMPSYTYALKGKKLLHSRGYPCEVRKREKSCGYSLHIYGECNAALELLERYSIPYTLNDAEVYNDKL